MYFFFFDNYNIQNMLYLVKQETTNHIIKFSFIYELQRNVQYL